MAVAQQPLDDICARTILKERKPLAYAPVQERDILWEKRVWRVLDLRQKMNQQFTAPESQFCEILINGIKEGKLNAFSPEDEKFSFPLPFDELLNTVEKIDSVEIVDPETFISSWEVVRESLNPQDIKKIRIKEIWYVDSKTSQLKVRILGIAPVLEVFDDFGNVLYEKPLFWIHYSSSRAFLAQHQVVQQGNARPTISWEDQLERRFFASTIYKVSNIHDERISASYAGINALEEAFKQKQEIFNFEHDLWIY